MEDSTDTGANPPVAIAPDEVFAALGNETRMAILQALWEAIVPGEPATTGALSFSELQDRVGVRDSGQFNYHLDKLTDRFVEHTEEGYVLRPPGGAVIRAVTKGTLTEEIEFEDEPVDVECPHCGAGVLIGYDDDRLFFRCSSCEGSYRFEGYPEGTLTSFTVPPVVLLNRTPREVFRDATLWAEHQHRLIMNGVCPECSGTVTTTPYVCEDHAVEPGRVCEVCRSVHPIRFLHVCEVCKLSSWLSAMVHVFTDPTVEAFYAEHGIGSFGPDYFRIWPDTIADQAVVSEDPLRVRVTVSIGGDRMEVTLDERGRVVESS